MTLLCPEYAPISSSLAFVRGDYAFAARAMLERRRSQNPCWSIAPVTCNPIHFGRVLEPLNQSPTIFGETNSEWLFIISLHVTTYTENLVELFRSSCVHIEHQESFRNPVTRRGSYRCDMFEYMQFQDLGDELLHRRIQVSEELSGRLYVASEGDTLDFEDRRMSSKQFVKQNFSLATINKYTEKLGIRFRDELFYTGRAVRLALDTPYEGPRTLEDYRETVAYESPL